MSDNPRKYLTTHSFIKFSLDLRESSYELWLLLGAAESKCKHLAGIPLRPEKQKELNKISLQKGVRATTAIEGNTLTEEDIEKIYQGQGDKIPRSRQYQVREVKNVLDVYNGIINDIADGKENNISLETLKRDNAMILKGIKLEKGITAGEIRTYPVVVGRYKGAPAEDCEFLLSQLIEWISQDWGLGMNYPLVEGILKAVTAHLYIAWIHPFGDGNGRTARMLEFRLLMKAGVPLTAAHLLTSYYNDTRELYYEKLRTSAKEKNGELDYIQYALQGFVDALDAQIRSILAEQLDVTWENYIYEEIFSGKLTEALKRRRDLLLLISKFDDGISSEEMKYRLPDWILKQYQDGARKLLMDLNYLEKDGLLYRTDKVYIAAKDKMKAFLPFCSS